MEGTYDIFLGEEKIGKMYVDRQGLYLRFRCRCALTGKVIYKIIAVCGSFSENLGIPVPAGHEFVLETKLPAKRFPTGAFEFFALPRHNELREKFIPISPQEPFSYIAELKTAYLRRRDGQIGVMIPEK